MAALQIHVIGLGVEVPAQLSDKIIALLKTAEQVIGWQRHQDMIAPLFQQVAFQCVNKLTDVDKLINEYAQSVLDQQAPIHLCILASGDPLFFGIGKWLQRYAQQHQLIYYPAVSSVQAACHRQGISLQDISVISLHGRPVQSLRRQLKKNRTLAVLTDQYSTPSVLARECIQAGFDQSRITVHENLGYADERSLCYPVVELVNRDQNFSALHVSLIEVKGDGQFSIEFPGIPDAFFETGTTPGKGMISKREVRLSILSFMQPSNGDVIWDIGAGCGGVAIELSYWNSNTQVFAVEYHPQRLSCLKQNRERFGVLSNLNIIEGKAPESLTGLPAPNKVFIGGNDGELSRLLDLAWSSLPIGGLLVASGVIDSTKQALTEFCETKVQQQQAQVESLELGVKRGAVQDGSLSYASKLPVEIFKLIKTRSEPTL
jgi:precorrin-6B C5,15-methyltransferase / cobalt-precorrin-6B C5,C15-methyltransferase